MRVRLRVYYRLFAVPPSQPDGGERWTIHVGGVGRPAGWSGK